jgi:hypothetical protein
MFLGSGQIIEKGSLTPQSSIWSLGVNLFQPIMLGVQYEFCRREPEIQIALERNALEGMRRWPKILI